MLMTSMSHGVCAACTHGGECVMEEEADSMILQCEQFEMAFPEAVSPPARPYVRTRDEYESNGYAGICSTCAHRATCTYPRPEGAIWRCEDYV